MSLLRKNNSPNGDDVFAWHFIKKKDLPPKNVKVLCYGTIKLGADGFQKRVVEDYFVAYFEPWPDAPHRFKSRFTFYNAWILEVEKWRFIEPCEPENNGEHAA